MTPQELTAHLTQHFEDLGTIPEAFKTLDYLDKVYLYNFPGKNFQEQLTHFLYGGMNYCTVCKRKILVEDALPLLDPELGLCYRHTEECPICTLRPKEFQVCVVDDTPPPEITEETIDVTPFVLGGDYPEGTHVFYSHESGAFVPKTMSYILSAKTDLIDYNTFDIFDWNILSNTTWILNRASVDTEKYDIFPGDFVLLNSEEVTFYNPHNAITTSDILLAEFETIYYKRMGLGVSSVQLKTGTNLFYLNIPLAFDEEAFGLIDNSVFNGKGDVTIGFDNIPNQFDAYFKLQVTGNPLVRTTYPEISTPITVKWVFSALHRPEVDDTDFSSFNFQNHPQSKPTFANSGAFCYFHFWKDTDVSNTIHFEQLATNFTPTIFS